MENSVLVVNLPGFLPIPDMRNSLKDDDEYFSVSSESAALAALKASHEKITVCLVNAPSIPIFSAARELSLKIKTVLMSSQVITEYMPIFGDNFSAYVDHVIANRLPPKGTQRETEVLLRHYMYQEEVGISSYLNASAEIQSQTIQSSSQREIFYQAVGAYVKTQVRRGSIAKSAQTISEELMMNALYDAPHAAGKIDFSTTDRSAPISLEQSDVATLSYGFDGDSLAISVKDPFGLLKKDHFLKYMAKVLRRQSGESILDKKKLGAGIGLFMILYNCHSLICRVDSGKSTEVIAIININFPMRDLNISPRTISFFD